MKPFLIIQLRAEDETADSEFRAFLRYGGLKKDEVVRVRGEKNGLPEIDLADYSGIIVGGSPFDLTTPEDEKSEIQLKVEEDFDRLFDRVVKTDFPFLGACSGNGLLGTYCGADISRKYGEPISGVDIVLTNEGKSDELLKDLPETFRALVGHKEACDSTPPGAVLLASSAACPVQMFRVGQNIYATQFHPEANQNEFILRIQVYRNHGYFDPKDAEEIIERIKKEEVTVPKEILRRFVKKYRK